VSIGEIVRLQESSRTPRTDNAQERKPNKVGMAIAFSGALLMGSIMGCSTANQQSIRVESGAVLPHAVSMPFQIKGGKGTRQDRFKARLELGREGVGTGSLSLGFPLTVEVDGMLVCFEVDVSMSQLKAENRDEVASELLLIIRRGAEAYRLELGGQVSVDPNEALESFAKMATQMDAEIKLYLDGAQAESPRPVEQE
jgi:hypothetical protein